VIKTPLSPGGVFFFNILPAISEIILPKRSEFIFGRLIVYSKFAIQLKFKKCPIVFDSTPFQFYCVF